MTLPACTTGTQDLLALAAEERPDVMILMGPFLDARHKVIREGDFDVTYEELFRAKISSELHAFVDALSGSGTLGPFGPQDMKGGGCEAGGRFDESLFDSNQFISGFGCFYFVCVDLLFYLFFLFLFCFSHFPPSDHRRRVG